MNKKLKVGDNVKITGGKYKKFETGVLTTLKPTYCDVDFGGNGLHKVKVDYIFPIVDMVVDMPEAEQLQDVGQNPDDFIADNPELIKTEELAPDEEEFASLEEKINDLEEKANYYISEASVFEAERDQADKKVLEQDEEIDKLKSQVISLTGRNQYLEGICKKLLLP